MDFLLELRTEELPASHIGTALEQLEAGFRRELEAAGIGFTSLRALATPRRLIVIGDLERGQKDREDVVVGPPLAVARASDGSLAAAGQGFARSHGVPEERLEVVRTPKGEYLGYRRRTAGTPTSVLLRTIVPSVLGALSFPKTMRWGTGELRFSRPVHGLVCLFDGSPVETAFLGLTAGDTTVGHRSAGPEPIRVRSSAEYADELKKRFVLIDPEERKRRIEEGIDAALAPLGASVYPDPELLEELSLGLEHPLVFVGSFPETFLTLPLEVLATAMREGQSLFSVVKGGSQLARFVGVADAVGDAKGFISRGNERVLRARLEDARFFWEQDRKVSLKERSAGLKDVVFQEKLGSYEDKAQRLRRIVAYLADKVEASKVKAEAVEAAALCKADLLTEMVKEFPSLQGRMGGLYAKEEGLAPVVCQAIYEHYQPMGTDSPVPGSMAGALLAVADKMDTLVGVLGLGTQVSGSSDPFGLRRSALGVCRIILERKLRFSMGLLIDRVVAAYGDRLVLGRQEVKKACLDFLAGRLRFILERKGYRYDLIKAALGPGNDRLTDVLLRVEALDALKSSPQFEPFILMARRINNILRSAGPAKLNPDLFVEKEERELYAAFSIIRENARPMIARGDFARAQNIVFKVQPVVNAFFDKVLVMAEEKKVRQNRLGLLQALSALLGEIADYSQIVLEGETSEREAGRA